MHGKSARVHKIYDLRVHSALKFHIELSVVYRTVINNIPFDYALSDWFPAADRIDTYITILVYMYATNYVCVCVCKWPSCREGLVYMVLQAVDQAVLPPDMAQFLDRVKGCEPTA